MKAFSRRHMVKGVLVAGIAAASDFDAAVLSAQTTPALQYETIQRKGRIKQAVSRGCYPHQSVAELCAFGAHIGLQGIDLLTPEEFTIPEQCALRCTMGYADAGSIKDGLNRLGNHDRIETGLRKNLPLAAKAGVPNVITFSGVRTGLSDDEGLKNSIIGLNRVKKIAEDNGVTICIELLNSEIDHHDYMADNSAWGIKLMEAVNSPNVRILYDIYHMQIQEGDLIRTIQANMHWIGHFHTAGVPGRHELNDRQEVQWNGVMRAIAATSFQGFVAHEFFPVCPDPLQSLHEAVTLCDV